MLYLLLATLVLCQAYGLPHDSPYLQHWNNDFDGVLDFKCPKGWGVVGVKSVHSNHHEDRRFEYFCSKITDDVSDMDCSWSGYVNSYDKPVHYLCPADGFISGVYSVHDNHKEDRIWQYRCCKEPNIFMTGCVVTGYTNNWDQPEDYHTQRDYVIKGVISHHDNHKEDRRFKYVVCNVKFHSDSDERSGASLFELLLNNESK